MGEDRPARGGWSAAIAAEVLAGIRRGRVLSPAAPLQHYVRDAIAARQHMGVSEESYERLGRLRLAAAER